MTEQLKHALSMMSDDDICYAIRNAQPVGTCVPGDDYDYIVGWNGQHWKMVADRPYTKGGYTCGWPWEQREGKPWQEALEGIVLEAFEARTFAVGL